MSGVSDWQKYEELTHWTKGKARKYVPSYEARPPAEALALAKQKLMAFFAAIPRTANEIFEPLKKGKAISLNDKEGYQTFLCDLEKSENESYVHNDAHLLNDVDQIKSLVATRMPKAQKEFSKYAKLFFRANGIITFLTLKDFVSEQISDLSMPCSGMAFDKIQSGSKSGTNISTATKPTDTKVKVKTEKASIASTEAAAASSSSSNSPSEDAAKRKGRAPCAKCEKMHNLYDCLEFKKMNAVERIKFCYDQKICFRCCNLRTHGSYRCPMKSTCSCGSTRHNGLIHLDEEGNKEFGEFVKQRKE